MKDNKEVTRTLVELTKEQSIHLQNTRFTIKTKNYKSKNRVAVLHRARAIYTIIIPKLHSDSLAIQHNANATQSIRTFLIFCFVYYIDVYNIHMSPDY